MAEFTILVIKVDLQCCKCYKKVKKILCKIPQIQDQVYDEKQNTVTIKVACCCSPERMMQKIRWKGGKSIISIEIKPPPQKEKEKPPPQEEKEKPPPQEEKEKPPPQEEKEKPPPQEEKEKPPPQEEKEKPPDKKPDPNIPKDKPPTKVVIEVQPNPPPNVPILGCRPGYVYPVPYGVCCRECSEGRRGGPCEQLAYGRPPCYGGYYGRPVYDSWGGGCGCGCNRVYYCRDRCGYYYYCEENPSSCSIM